MDGDDVDIDLASSPESEADPTSPSWIEAPWAVLTRTGFAAGVDAVDATRNSAASAAAPPPAPKDDGAGLRTAGYIAGGVGIAGFILFAVAGIGAKNAHDRLDEACNAGRCTDASHDSDIADGKRLQTAANIGLATGLIGLGLGATLIALGIRSPSDAVPAVGMSGGGGLITFAGRF